jgi:ribose transport system permease protein/putative xylitol transport system permease protein
MLRDLLPYAALVILVVYFSLATDAFFTVENLVNIVRQSAILMVIAVGATLVVVAGSVDLSVGAISTLSGTLAAYTSAHGQPGLAWAMVLVGVAAGLLNGTLVAYVRLPSFIVTLGTLFIFGGIATKIVGGYAVPLQNKALDDAVNSTTILGIPNGFHWAIGAIIVVSVIAYRTTFGRHLYAIGGNEKVAGLAGLPVRRDKALMFVLSGTLAAIGGLMLTARGGGSSPTMGDSFLLNAIAAIVMGGTPLSGGSGGPFRTILGVLTIVVLGDGMTLAAVDPYYQNVVFGAVVIAAVAVTVRRSEVAAVK